MSKKAQLSAIKTTEQPILLTVSKINRLGYKFPKSFRLKGAVKSRLVLVLGSKGPYYPPFEQTVGWLCGIFRSYSSFAEERQLFVEFD